MNLIVIVTFIGASSRMARRKDIAYGNLMEKDILGNSCRVRSTGMEYGVGIKMKNIMVNLKMM
jgi:hypothetical protein